MWLNPGKYLHLPFYSSAVLSEETRSPRAQTAARTVGHAWLSLVHVTLLGSLLALPLYETWLLVWPRYLVIPLLLYSLLVCLWAPLRDTRPRLRLGRVNLGLLGTTSWIVVCSSALLVGCAVLFHLDFAFFRERTPHWPWPRLLLLGGGICAANAFLEEWIWRGVLLDSAVGLAGRDGGILLQAAGFGAAHVFFLPVTFLGIGLAFLYGLTLGWLRLRSHGLGLPVLAHFCIDMTIFALVLAPPL
jgi:membrane protease YdiL (CAAX protease family)